MHLIEIRNRLSYKTKRNQSNQTKRNQAISCFSFSLQTLCLDGNHLSSLPEELGGLSQLNSLGLSFNNFSQIPAVLERLSAVDKLAMAGNRVESLELSSLARMSHLKIIDLRWDFFLEQSLNRALNFYPNSNFSAKIAFWVPLGPTHTIMFSFQTWFKPKEFLFLSGPTESRVFDSNPEQYRRKPHILMSVSWQSVNNINIHLARHTELLSG